GFAAGIAVRRRTHVLPVHDETGPFQPISVTSPALFELDPRTEAGARDETSPPGPEALAQPSGLAAMSSAARRPKAGAGGWCRRWRGGARRTGGSGRSPA